MFGACSAHGGAIMGKFVGKWVKMHLQTRDRYDNVRCLDLANDTLIIGVTRLGKMECNPEHPKVW